MRPNAVERGSEIASGARGVDDSGAMRHDAELHCRCDEVRGRVANVSPNTVNRVVCYCDDCQAFLHHLGREDLLDEHGGTDIAQVAPASLSFDRGADRIVGVRLTPRGLYRWYTSCCKTPVGNTLTPAIPFVGMVTRVFGSDADDLFGKPVGAIFGKYAIGDAPQGSTTPSPRLLLRSARMLLGWRLRGQSWPHPFFERTPRVPRHQVTTLSYAEREALRPRCGPQPASAHAS